MRKWEEWSLLSIKLLETCQRMIKIGRAIDDRKMIRVQQRLPWMLFVPKEYCYRHIKITWSYNISQRSGKFTAFGPKVMVAYNNQRHYPRAIACLSTIRSIKKWHISTLNLQIIIKSHEWIKFINHFTIIAQHQSGKQYP